MSGMIFRGRHVMVGGPDFHPGDPCGACGARRTIWRVSGEHCYPHCQACGASDAEAPRLWADVVRTLRR